MLATQRSAARRIPAGRRIRVLVVDDSVVIRRLVTQALSEDPAFEVAGVAANGSIALARIPQVNPDVITLDIEMPEVDGLETLRRLRKSYPQLCVIMFSTLTERAAKHTLEALALGANDYVAKASNIGSLDKSMSRLRGELLPKIRQFFQLENDPLPRVAELVKAPPLVVEKKPPVPLVSVRREVVAIGISTGGPNALAEVIPQFPANFPCPILIVQHMPPLFTRLLAERLSSRGKIRVEEAAEGSLIEKGKALIAPGDYHMTIRRAGNNLVVRLDQGPPENSCRPAADALFRSAS